MKPQLKPELKQGDRAVSPVIGVILMVAITVILAAVIGAFVLEIGDQQETAPSTSFDSEQATEFYEAGTTTQGGSPSTYNGPQIDGTANLTTVYITHAGGDVLEISNTEIVIEGNDSVWGVDGDKDLGKADEGKPQPDLRPTFGSNDAVEFSSGDEWNVIGDASNGRNKYMTDEAYDRMPYGGGSWADEAYNAGFQYTSANGEEIACSITGGGTTGYGHFMTSSSDHECVPGDGTSAKMRTLQTGDSVNVVWTASSGGKTQTLFKYTVQ